MERAPRWVQKVSATRAFARLAPSVLPAVDRGLHRLTRGKVLLSARLLPSVVLISTGARSGRSRRTPLACMPEEGGRSWILVGSNFGRTGHPAWTYNLLARPEAVISLRGEDIPVTARLLEGQERAAVWQAVREFWPPYAVYQGRVAREIRLFRLLRR